jgi:hypothetical protein
MERKDSYTSLMMDNYFLYIININKKIISSYKNFIYSGVLRDEYIWF